MASVHIKYVPHSKNPPPTIAIHSENYLQVGTRSN